MTAYELFIAHDKYYKTPTLKRGRSNAVELLKFCHRDFVIRHNHTIKRNMACSVCVDLSLFLVWRADLSPPLLHWYGAEERSGDS